MTSRDPTRSPLQKVLVANRGEIAVRIVRGLRDAGIRSAVIYSEADRLGLPVLLADEAYSIGPAPSNESYLRAEAIVELALSIGADGIHPGYGFLSENADFAHRCRQAGIVFIGPPPEAIAAMGSKVESRRLMMDADVPVVPGGRDPLPDLAAAEEAAAGIGYPVMLKAASGGGGKGMRLVRSPEELAGAFRGARSEARASFGDDDVYLEKFIEEPRHVEIQVLGDHHGNLVSLGERECSLQRRHQKVVEEAPSPAVDEDLRRRMGEAAVKAARAVGYTNAGTVEFLLAKGGEFYFLEVNTRLQVEHPITEAVTGIDLVAAQLAIAQGEPLAPACYGVQPRGHAIELRIYAEDPYRGFVPSPGRIDRLRWPEGPGIRVDAGVYEGSEVSIYYDPMLAKLLISGADRQQALARMGRALEEMRIEGIETTVPLYSALLEDEDFLAGRLDIAMLDRKMAAGGLLPPRRPEEEDLSLVAAALAHFESGERQAATPAVAGGHRSGWRQSGRLAGVGSGPWN